MGRALYNGTQSISCGRRLDDQGVSSVEPDDSRHEENSRQKGAGKLVVASGNDSEALQLVEESLDEITFAVQGEIGIADDQPIRLGRDDGADVALHQGVAIVGLVGDECLRLDLVEQRGGLAEVRDLTGGQGDRHWVAQGVHDGMDLRRPPPRDRPMAWQAPPFFAPWRCAGGCGPWSRRASCTRCRCPRPEP